MQLPIPFWNATDVCCSQPKGNGSVELILVKPFPPPESQATTKCKCRGVHHEKIPCQTEQKRPKPFVCESFKHQSFFTVSFHDTLAGAHGSVSERVPMTVIRVFVFQCTQCLSWVFLTFHHHQQEYRPLKWTKEGKSGLAGPQHWVMERLCGLSGGMNRILKKDAFLLVTLRMS